MKTTIFMESTGVYHLTLFHFLKDALTIATIGNFQNVKYSSNFDVEIYTLKSLCRDYYKFTDSKSTFKKKLSTDLRVIFPSYSSVFSDITGKTSIAILKKYSSLEAVLSADRDELINLISSNSRKGLAHSEKIYKKLYAAAEEAVYIGLKSPSLFVKIINTIAVIESLEIQIGNLLMRSNRISDEFKKNVQLLYSIPGVGELTSITIMSETGNIKGFVKPKHLIA